MNVKRFYKELGENEWQRLVKDSFHNLELKTTFHYLKQYLPKKGNILDAGGGPGRYTIELAKRGYYIVLLDLVPEMLKTAKREIKKAKVQTRVKQLLEGSIDDLSKFGDDTFDAVLCLGGPLNHLLNIKQRVKAASELV